MFCHFTFSVGRKMMGRVKDMPGLRAIGCGKTVMKNRVEGHLDNATTTRGFAWCHAEDANLAEKRIKYQTAPAVPPPTTRRNLQSRPQGHFATQQE